MENGKEKKVRMTLWTAQRNIVALEKLTAIIKEAHPDVARQISKTAVADLVFEAGLKACRERYKKDGKTGLTPKPEITQRLVWDEEAIEKFGK